MNAKSILHILARHYKLIARNEYHVQIQLDKGMYHEFWLGKFYGIKVRLYGQRHTTIYRNIDTLLNQLRKYNYKTDSDLSQLIELDNLSSKIIKGKDGIYCDAGFKNGKAKIAVIRIQGKDIDLAIRHNESFNNSMEAEIAALRFAIRTFPMSTEFFSDCLGAVNEINQTNQLMAPICFWINRENNTIADSYSNLRGKG